jgi:hypothetical protein
MAEAAAKKIEEARLIAPITIDRIRQAEQTIVNYEVILPSGIEPDDILPVQFWSHYGARFKAAHDVGSSVELIVTAEDKKWRARMFVIDAGVNWAKVVFETTEKGERVITRLGGLQPVHKVAFLPGHTVNYGGTFSRWRVIRDTDSKVLIDKLNTEGDAYSWLANYAKTVTST